MRTLLVLGALVLATAFAGSGLAQGVGMSAGFGVPGATEVLQGRILDATPIDLGTSVGVRLITQDGNVVLLDLGPPAALNGLTLRPGGFVFVRGREGFNNLAPTVYVDQIAPVFTINRFARTAPASPEEAVPETPEPKKAGT
jgi:hypothetical protein